MLHFVRHPPVAKMWQKRCYGQSDPGLSQASKAMIAPLIHDLASHNPKFVIHSDMKRTRAFAERLAHHVGIECIAEPLWRERDFGTWEGQSWNAIYRATGNAMDGMLEDPDHFRPGGGETTGELIARDKLALERLPLSANAVIISHGGPIAALRLIVQELPIDQMTKSIPQTGEVVSIPASKIQYLRDMIAIPSQKSRPRSERARA